MGWKSIIRSVPVWALATAHVCQNWGFYTLLTDLPTYMKNILHFDIKKNAFISSLPFFAMWMFILCFSSVPDFLIASKYLSTTTVRKLSMSLGSYIPALLLILMSHSGCMVPAILCLLIAAVTANGSARFGYLVNHIDLSPNFAGTLIGITNCLANITGFVSPTMTGYIIDGHQDLEHWQVVFGITAVVYFVGSTVFVVLGSGVEQPWNSEVE